MDSEFALVRQAAATWALALLLMLRSDVALAADTSVARIDCERGVCGFNVVDRALLTEPCADVPVLVAYLATGGPAAIHCGEGPDRAPLAYVFDRRAPEGLGFEIEGARWVESAFLAEAAKSGVPDRFGTVALCQPPSAAAARANNASLWLILKVPAAGSPAGACYRLLRAVATRRGVSVLADDGNAGPGAAAVETRRQWQPLLTRLLPLMHR